MKQEIERVISHKLFSGSVVVIFGTNVVNALNYIYHLVMGRILGPQSYGELAGALSLMTLLSMIPLSLGLIVTKYVSASKGTEEVKNVTYWFKKKILIIAFGLSLLTVTASPFISRFMNLSNEWILPMIAAVFLFQIPLAFNRALLQGVLSFNIYVASFILEAVIKLGIGVSLVFLGLSLYGVVFAILIGVCLAWLLTLKRASLFMGNSEGDFRGEKIKGLLLYSLPVILQSIAITSFFSIDIVLVKHFFSSFDSGIYAAMSTLGKIIYFAAGPIALVMFPIVSSRQAKGEQYFKVFISSFALTASISGIILLFYWLVPHIAISMLFGSLFLSSSYLLPLFGLFITFLTLSYLVMSYFLSINRTKVVILPIAGALLQICGILLFHRTLQEVVMVSVIVSGVLFASLCLFFVKRFSAKL